MTCRLTAVIWSKSKPDVEFQYGRRLREFHGMSSQSHCHIAGCCHLVKFTAMIPVPHATLQGAVTWRNQCHDRATLHGVIILSAILKIVLAIFYFLGFFNAVWALTSGSFRIVYDTLVTIDLQRLTCRYNVSRFSGEDKRKLISVRQKMRRQYGITRSHGTGHTTE